MNSITLLLSLSLLSSVSAQSPVAIEKEPRHQLKFENQFVRVFDVRIPPGDTTLFHTHTHDGVGIKLTDARLRSEVLGGSVDEVVCKRGEVDFTRFPNPLTHKVGNIGATPFRNIFIEILSSSAAPASTPSPAAVADHTVVLENERARVLRLELAPGQSTAERTHVLGGVRVALSEGNILIASPDRDARTVKVGAGDYEWVQGGTKESLKNVGSAPCAVVEIELK